MPSLKGLLQNVILSVCSATLKCTGRDAFCSIFSIFWMRGMKSVFLTAVHTIQLLAYLYSRESRSFPSDAGGLCRRKGAAKNYEYAGD